LEIADSFLLGAYRKVSGQGESNGDITDDVTGPYDVIVVTYQHSKCLFFDSSCRNSTQIVATGLMTSFMTSSSHNISVKSLQESGQLESKGHLTDDVTQLDYVISVVMWGWGRGHPTPRNFFDQKCYFSHISPKFDLRGLQKWGRYPLP